MIVSIWYVFLFVGQPEGVDALAAAQQQAISALDPKSPDSAFFIGSMVSALLCLTAAMLFLAGKSKAAVGFVAVNTLTAVVLFSPILAVAIGMPLLLAGKVWKNT